MDSDDESSPCVLVLIYDAADGTGTKDQLMPIESIDDVWRVAADLKVERDFIEFHDSCWEALARGER
jgi:hypothetical protein